MAGGHLAADVLHEQRQVVEPRTERRHREDDPAQPVVEVLADAALGDRRAQVTMRRRDQPDVRVRSATRTYRPHLAVSQEPEEHRLRIRRELADLSRNTVPPSASRKSPAAARGRP